MLMHIKSNKNLFHLMTTTYLWRIVLQQNTNITSLSLLIKKLKYLQKMQPNKKNTESLSLLNKQFKLWQLMWLQTKYNISCFPHRRKQDSWKIGLNNVMNIWQKRRRKFLHRWGLLLLPSMKKLISINQLLNFYMNIFTRIQHWHWLSFIVVQQILMWQYSTMNYNQMFIDQSYGIAFQTWLGVPLGKKKQCFAKRHSITLINHTQGLLPVHLVVNAFWV